jgi:hypothetical protein
MVAMTMAINAVAEQTDMATTKFVGQVLASEREWKEANDSSLACSNSDRLKERSIVVLLPRMKARLTISRTRA